LARKADSGREELSEALHGGELEWVVAKQQGVPIGRLTSFANTVSPEISPQVNNLRHRFRELYLYAPRDPDTPRRAIAKSFSVETRQVLIGSGSTELIHLFFQVISPGHVVIPVPTYSEYALAAKKWGCPTTLVPMTARFDLDLKAIQSAITDDTRAIILCNPNNPTGKLYTRDALESVIRLADRSGATLLVDEAYLCFAKGGFVRSLSGAASRHNVVLVHRLSKLSGAPSLRLGWMISSPSRIREFAERKVPGTVGNLALWLTEPLLRDRTYRRRIQAFIERERQFLEKELSDIAGLCVFPSDCNFILIRLDARGMDSNLLFNQLARQHLVIRAAGNIPGLDRRYFRVTVRKHQDNLKLIRAIRVALT
jgi:threonine-phosphate decarboxylase